MTTRGGQTLTWDADNRLTAVTGGATFAYDGNGSRVSKTEGGETILYYGKYLERNLTAGETTRSYYFGGTLVAQKKGATLTYLNQDHLSGTGLQSDTGGATVATIAYYPFGGTRATSGSLTTDKKFTGQLLDATGLYYRAVLRCERGEVRESGYRDSRPVKPASMKPLQLCLEQPAEMERSERA